jgi:hypothetical protein
MIALVNPPVVKSSEPPPGVYKLLAAMNTEGVDCTVWDANIECLSNLLEIPRSTMTAWTTRAVRGLKRNLNLLKTLDGYTNFDRYKRAVSDINHLLEISGAKTSVKVSLTDYQDPDLSPVKSQDLITSAERPEKNIFFPLFSKSLEKLLIKKNPAVIGFSLNYFSQALTAFAMIGFLKQKNPSVKILAGGGLVTSWLNRPGWKSPFKGLIDETIAGPGENALFFHATSKNVNVKPAVPGYGSAVMDDYLSPGPVIPYSASSGCYWSKCGFCPEQTEGNPYRPAPVQRVTEDLRELVKTHSPILIHFLDSALSPDLMENLAKHPPGAPWYGFARFTRHLTDEHFCARLKRSGCIMLQLGLESGDQRVLDNEKKGITLERASKALSALKKAGIASYVYLLFGTPSETYEAAVKTLEYVTAHAAFIDFLNVAIFNLPIDSKEERQLTINAFSEGDLSLYSNFIHPKGWDRKQVRRFLNKAFKRHPAISPIIKNDPPYFTSNHAPFFCRGLQQMYFPS